MAQGNPFHDVLDKMQVKKHEDLLDDLFRDRTYGERYQKTSNAVRFLTVFVHGLSVICGMVGLMRLLSIFIGSEFSLMTILKNPDQLGIVVALASVAILVGLEFVKSREVSEYYRDKFKHGKTAMKDGVLLGVIVSIANIGLSIFGAVTIGQELTNVKANNAHVAIDSQYNERINALTASVDGYKNDKQYRNSKGEILWTYSKPGGIIESQEQELSSLIGERDAKKGEVDAAYGLGVYTVTDSGAKTIMSILFYGQFVIEFLIYFFSYWLSRYQYKSWLELKSRQQATPQHVPSSNGGGIPHTAFGGALNNANNPIINSLKKKVAELEEQLEGISEVLPEPINREELYNRLQVVDTNKVLVKGYSTEGDKIFTYGECGQKVNQYKKRSTPLAKRNEVLFSIARDLLENNTKTNA